MAELHLLGMITPIPRDWFVGAYEMQLDTLIAGKVNAAGTLIEAATGTAWLRLPCAVPPVRPFPDKIIDALPDTTSHRQVAHAVEVVAEVFHPQTEISVADAARLGHRAVVGETVVVPLGLSRRDLQSVIRLERGISDWLGTRPLAAGFAVEFHDVTVSLAEAAAGRARIVDGSVTYPITGAGSRRPIEIVIAGFTLVLSSLDLTPHRSTATAEVRVPGDLSDAGSCAPATIDLGIIAMSPTCDFFIERLDDTFGPWLLGDTGMAIEGTGFALDLSTTVSHQPGPAAFCALTLFAGTASGAHYIPEPCNTGYLRGDYTFANAVVVSSGFFGSIYLAAPVAFTALNPIGQKFAFDAGAMDVWYSRIVRGELKRGATEFPIDAVCAGKPGSPVTTPIAVVSVQPDLDLAGVVDHGQGEVSWGELTHHGDEIVAWTGLAGRGYLYLPAGAMASYSPAAGGTFTGPMLSWAPDASLAELEAHHAAGVTFFDFVDALVFSPDRPGGRGNPIKLPRVQGWLRVGITGVDGALVTNLQLQKEDLGDPVSTGYVGNQPFVARLFGDDKMNLLAEFVSSAGYDSNFTGTMTIPVPCDIAALEFAQIKLTSTACLVGGDLHLPPAGVPLDSWGLMLVPTGSPTQAGVLSVRTGRVLLTAAGIAEPAHFARPFGLTWGEMLADGNLGELFLDHNSWGQRFDGLGFTPHEIALSKFDPLAADPYLGVFGAVLFPFFGLHQINVCDAKAGGGRFVTVPKAPITPHAAPTALALSGTWHDVGSAPLAAFDCLEMDVDYDVATQNGFVGTGSGEFGFLHSDPLDITVEIHDDATDIHISSIQAHDLDVGVIARVGGMGQIEGCARIEGPTLKQISMYGVLEHSAAAGSIFGPKAGFETEINLTVTPTTLDFYAAGDVILSAALVDLEASATVHLFFDFAMGVAEGELFGHVNCDAAVAGLSGDGQLTWHVSPTMQYLQGRLKVGVISPIVSGGLEGGFFIGNNVPKALAWVLDPTDSHFGMSRSILPATLTGVYGYGQASIGFNAYVLGGGVDIWAGAGAFSAPIAAGGPLAPFAGNPMLPFVVGACGIYVHGEILGGLVSASAWANLSLRGPLPTYFEGTFGLRGCVLWVLCASVSVTAGVNESGFHLS